ncbi:serine protease [Pseudenhygromyxa sp. WMMC2535]|uniref:S1C family serine protease n=1 Tax=Pseudenhygromyxa sp. WMMC2535 TaxID=2712867 RepID=UPI001555F9E3|nr:serine protease [Pseudenhygromyxa sp. WMMC2535]NVB37285.1 serine protease [Pseudenhygromyxa sp. WMMC2535]
MTMMIIRGLLSLLLTASLLAPASAQTPVERGAQSVADIEQWRTALYDSLADSVVFISTKQGHGSGFFISDDGWILTAAHVVGDAKTVSVVLRDGRRLQGSVQEKAKGQLDFALLWVDLKQTKALALADADSLAVGAWVGSIGHGTGGVWTFNIGMISNIYPVGAQKPVFQTDIPLNPGNSGGPIFDRQGRVVGIVTAGIQSANNVNYGIKIDEALGSLDQIGFHCQCWLFVAPKNVAIFLDGEAVGSGPKLVIPAQEGTHEVFAVVDGVMKKYALSWPTHRGVDFTK